MKVKFKDTSTLLIAKALGSEAGIVTSMTDDDYDVQFPIYGVSFRMGKGEFVVEDPTPINDIPIAVDIPVVTQEVHVNITMDDRKKYGKEYVLNGVAYQVPLDRDAQNIITTLAVQNIVGLFESTKITFSNGVAMPIAKLEFMPFATWFSTERGSFFK